MKRGRSASNDANESRQSARRGDRWRRGVKEASVWSDGVAAGMRLKIDAEDRNKRTITYC
jgi:hypothetical protein